MHTGSIERGGRRRFIDAQVNFWTAALTNGEMHDNLTLMVMDELQECEISNL